VIWSVTVNALDRFRAGKAKPRPAIALPWPASVCAPTARLIREGQAAPDSLPGTGCGVIWPPGGKAQDPADLSVGGCPKTCRFDDVQLSPANPSPWRRALPLCSGSSRGLSGATNGPMRAGFVRRGVGCGVAVASGTTPKVGSDLPGLSAQPSVADDPAHAHESAIQAETLLPILFLGAGRTSPFAVGFDPGPGGGRKACLTEPVAPWLWGIPEELPAIVTHHPWRFAWADGPAQTASSASFPRREAPGQQHPFDLLRQRPAPITRTG